VNPNYKVNDLLAHHNLGLGVTVQRSHTSGTETIFVPLGIGKTSGIMEDGIQLEVHLEMLEGLSRLSRRAGSDLVIGKKKKKSKHSPAWDGVKYGVNCEWVGNTSQIGVYQ